MSEEHKAKIQKAQALLQRVEAMKASRLAADETPDTASRDVAEEETSNERRVPQKRVGALGSILTSSSSVSGSRRTPILDIEEHGLLQTQPVNVTLHHPSVETQTTPTAPPSSSYAAVSSVFKASAAPVVGPTPMSTPASPPQLPSLAMKPKSPLRSKTAESSVLLSSTASSKPGTPRTDTTNKKETPKAAADVANLRDFGPLVNKIPTPVPSEPQQELQPEPQPIQYHQEPQLQQQPHLPSLDQSSIAPHNTSSTMMGMMAASSPPPQSYAVSEAAERSSLDDSRRMIIHHVISPTRQTTVSPTFMTAALAATRQEQDQGGRLALTASGVAKGQFSQHIDQRPVTPSDVPVSDRIKIRAANELIHFREDANRLRNDVAYHNTQRVQASTAATLSDADLYYGQQHPPPVGIDANHVDMEWLLRSQAGPSAAARRVQQQTCSTHVAPAPNVQVPTPTPRYSPPRRDQQQQFKQRVSQEQHQQSKDRTSTFSVERQPSPHSQLHTLSSIRRVQQPVHRDPVVLSPRSQVGQRASSTPRAADVSRSSTRKQRPTESTKPIVAAPTTSMQPKKSSSSIEVSDYTKSLLREHNAKRKKHANQQQQQHSSGLSLTPTSGRRAAQSPSANTRERTAASSSSRSLTRNTSWMNSGMAEGGAHTSSTSLTASTSEHRIVNNNKKHLIPSLSSKNNSSNQLYNLTSDTWQPLANRHARGGGVQYPSSIHREVEPRATGSTSIDSVFVSPTQRRHDPGTIDVSPISPGPQRTSMTPGQIHRQMMNDDGTAVATTAANTMPFVQYLRHVSSGGPTSFLASELECMGVATALRDGSDVTLLHCKLWAALTTILNEGVCLEHLVVPLLVSELQERVASIDPMKSSRSDGDISHLLCALVGLGDAAHIALELLTSMFEHGVGNELLVGLAIRVCGGSDGLRWLCDTVQSSSEQGVRLRALTALGMIPHAQAGHTTVLCLGLPQLRGKKMFYQPKVLHHQAGAGNNPTQALASTLKQPELIPVPTAPYRPTHVFIDAELVRRHLRQLVPTHVYAHRALETPRTSQWSILHDFFSCSPFACTRVGCDPNVHALLKTLEEELHAVLGVSRDFSDASDANVLLRNDMESLWREDALTVRQVTIAIVKILRDAATPPAVIEQALFTAAVLPSTVAEVMADPLVEFTTRLVDTFGSCSQQGGEGSRLAQTIATAAVAMSCVMDADVHSQKLLDSATAIGLHLLRHPDPSIRRAACLSLGNMGAVSSNPQAVIKLIVECLTDGYLQPDTACWALSRSGKAGIACLLDIASQTHLAPSQRIAAVRAVGFLEQPSHQQHSSSTSEGKKKSVSNLKNAPSAESASGLHAAVTKGLVRILCDNMSMHTGEQLAITALNTITTLHRDATVDESLPLSRRRRVDDDYAPNAVCVALTEVLNSSPATVGAARPVVLRELFTLLCRHGSRHGLQVASEYALNDKLAVSLRVAATAGLVGAGSACWEPLSLCLVSKSAEVRRAAVEVLETITVPTMMEFLRSKTLKNNGSLLSSTALRDQLAQRVSEALHMDQGGGKSGSALDEWFCALTANQDTSFYI